MGRRGAERPRRLSWLMVLWVVALLGPGCGCGPGSGSDAGQDAGEVCLAPVDLGGRTFTGLDAGPGGVPRSEFLAGVALAYCDALARCYPFDRSLVTACAETLPFQAWTPSQICRADECGASLYDLTSLRKRSEATWGVEYDPGAAAACLASPWACRIGFWSGNVPIPDACLRAFRPLVTDGGACELDGQCVSGTCQAVSPSLGCGGSCAPGGAPEAHPVAGSECGEDGGCGADAGLACDGFICRGRGEAGAECSGSAHCRPGLVCTLGDHSASCQPPVPLGGSCSYPWWLVVTSVFPESAWTRGPCEPGVLCVGSRALPDGGVRPGTCQRPARAGEPCLADDQTDRVYQTGCVLGLVCSCGVCAPAPLEGACGTGWTPCQPHAAFCGPGGVCLPSLGNFERCTRQDQCASGYCNPLSGRCEPLDAAGPCPG